MRLTCIHCDKPFEVGAEHLGAAVLCPHCRNRVRLPSTVAATARQDDQQGGGLRLFLRSAVSGVVSFVLHVGLLVTFAMVTCGYRGGGGMGEEVLIGELASEHLSENDKNDLDPADDAPITRQEAQDETFEEVSPPDPAADGEAVEVQVFQLAPSGSSGAAADIGTIGGGGGALGGGVNFMGVRGHGNRFCIIADRSGSMAGPKLEFVKQEILEALGTMKSRARFQLVFFNQGAQPYPEPGWRNPRKDRNRVGQWLTPMTGAGGTYPTPAFEIAFKLSPRPDVIFFMTDGLFPASVVDEVAALNRRAGKEVVIHAISFVDRSAEPLLRKIAKDSGGTYRHVAGF